VTIVGVAPPGFFGPEVGERFDVAVPTGIEPLVRARACAGDALRLLRVLALLLAGLGLYGVTACAVSRRHVEIGIRMALGARAQDVLRLVLLRVLLLVAAGSVIGGTVSLWASRLVAPLLYGLAPGDPATLAGALVVLTAVAIAAGALPAGRVAFIDPADVFRQSSR
jgi:ABC-type antimicrobial peptide transport system permease subunit